jgi:hypothetical protein
MPISRSFSPTGIDPISSSRMLLAISERPVSGPTQVTPGCIASLTFILVLPEEVIRDSMIPSPIRSASLEPLGGVRVRAKEEYAVNTDPPGL